MTRTAEIEARLAAATPSDWNCVDQTIFGDKQGNCNAACIATILDLPLSEVPNFPVIIPEGQDWQAAQNAWLANYGVVIFTVILKDDGKLPFMNALTDGIPCLISGKSPRGNFDHAVVGNYKLDAELGHSLEYIHDPHPSHKYLAKAKSVDFFIIINPAKIHHLLAELTKAKAEVERLQKYVAALEAECMAVTKCAYALSSAVNLAGNYDRNARILLHQEAKAERLFYDLFAANHEETVGVRLLREKNEAAAPTTQEQSHE